MKLRNKKTGKIIKLDINCIAGKVYENLAELNEEWEDYEEDELLYVVSAEHRSGYQCVLKEDYPEICKVAKELGIGFETEKECQKAVEKLKAWKRLKDKRFRFEWWKEADNRLQYNTIAFNSFTYNYEDREQLRKDLDLLFGGEE